MIDCRLNANLTNLALQIWSRKTNATQPKKSSNVVQNLCQQLMFEQSRQRKKILLCSVSFSLEPSETWMTKLSSHLFSVKGHPTISRLCRNTGIKLWPLKPDTWWAVILGFLHNVIDLHNTTCWCCSALFCPESVAAEHGRWIHQNQRAVQSHHERLQHSEHWQDPEQSIMGSVSVVSALIWTSIPRWITANLTVCTPFRQRDCMRKNNRGKDVAEKQLFHGTDRKHVHAICKNNFDWRICGTHGTAYGKGEVLKIGIMKKC